MSGLERVAMVEKPATSEPVVRLVAVSRPVDGSDPRRLVVLAVKVSQGRLHEKSVEHYMRNYPSKLVSEWIEKAYAFPSVLEHVTFTFLIEGISRVCSHQLVRHRIASYTQESQRYSESYARKALESILRARRDLAAYPRSEAIRKFVESANPIEILRVASEAFVIPPRLGASERVKLAKSLLQALANYYELIEIGIAPEDARFALPQAIKTRIMVTMNLRELIHVACLRLSRKAQWEIREVVRKMVEEASRVVPEVRSLIKSMCREDIEI